MLDLGGDKLGAMQHNIHENNPSMGERSMRLLLSHPKLFVLQLRAMIKSAHDRTNIIYPMISSLDELDNNAYTPLCNITATNHATIISKSFFQFNKKYFSRFILTPLPRL